MPISPLSDRDLLKDLGSLLQNLAPLVPDPAQTVLDTAGQMLEFGPDLWSASRHAWRMIAACVHAGRRRARRAVTRMMRWPRSRATKI
ncbi:hypothetical protein ACQP2Y_46865 (plasmid) [Actinoplanes sp. CA-051413]|uniref:hypothetical protein n=1 Tax=Actinoplanes sp. CA-051413 TaxID=3239899 RepID=UPI003D960645